MSMLCLELAGVFAAGIIAGAVFTCRRDDLRRAAANAKPLKIVMKDEA